MDPAALATTVTSLLAPYLAKAGSTLLDRAAAGLPDPLGHLWDTITRNFDGKPAAAGAATDLASHASDQDRQEAFLLQLKMALKNDPEFATAVQELAKKAGSDTESAPHINIKTGNVSGSAFVIGNNNDVKSG